MMRSHSGSTAAADGLPSLPQKSLSQKDLPDLPSVKRRHAFESSPQPNSNGFDTPPLPPDKSQRASNRLERSATQSESGSTISELVDRLLAPQMSKQDTKFVAVFLAFYRKFASPGELLAVILERFNAVTRNPKFTPHLVKAQAQLRHLAILDSWLANYPGDFAYPSTRKVLERFLARIAGARLFSVAAKELTANLDNVVEDDDTDWAFCDRNHEKGTKGAGGLAKEVVGLALSGEDTPPQTPSSTRSTSNAASVSSTQGLLGRGEAAGRLARSMVPTPRFPLTKVQWRALMDTPEDAIARELTRMDWVMFSAVRPRDLVRQVSLSTAAKAKCRSLENVQRMIEHFNHVANWTINFILLRDKPKHRALMLEKFMKIAREVRRLNNYNALGAILAGLSNSPVQRLQATRDLVPPSVSRDFMKLEILMSPQKSYFAYRLAWDNTAGERIPYMPLSRRDLVSAREGNSTFIGIDDDLQEALWLKGTPDKDARINWKKFVIMGEVIVSIQRAQGQPYPLAAFGKNDEVAALIIDTAIIPDEEVRSCGVASFDATSVTDLFDRRSTNAVWCSSPAARQAHGGAASTGSRWSIGHHQRCSEHQKITCSPKGAACCA